MTHITAWTKPGSFAVGRDPLGFQAVSVRLYNSLPIVGLALRCFTPRLSNRQEAQLLERFRHDHG